MTDKPKKHRSNFMRWFEYVWRHKPYLLSAFAAVFIAMAVEVLIPKIVGFVIDNMLTKDVISSGRVLLPLAGLTIIKKAFLIILGLLVVLYVILSICHYLRTWLLTMVGEKVHLDIRQDLFNHLQRLPISYFDTSYTGRIMARITTDADALWHLVHDGMLGVIAPGLTIIVVLVLLFRIHAGLTLFSMCIIPFILILFAFTRKKVGKSGRAQREALAQIYTRLQERISGIRLIKIFGREDTETESFSHDLKDLFRRNVEMMKAYAILGSGNLFFTGTVTAMILCFGGIAAYNGRIRVGELVQFYLYSGMLFTPLISITAASARVFTQAEIAMERIFSLLDTPVAQELHGPNNPCPSLKGEICFEHVSFSYYEGKQVLNDISLRIKAGRTVALVGPSGVGKTTLINLLCRFYQPDSGVIKVDGRDISEWDVGSFRRQISYVTQEDFLFSGTVADNLKFADPEAGREKIEEAARRANAHDFIMHFPHGYDTQIGERGVTLSGGQKQRLNLARALVREPSMLILDEPTSALDAESESIILDALGTIFKEKTCLIIAHRLSTVMSADNIIVFDEGRIVQQGTHKELLGQEGRYKELCKKQFVGYGGSTSREPEK